MRRILFCVFFGIIAFALLVSAQSPDNTIANLINLSHRGQLPQLIQTANSLLASDRLAQADKAIVLTYLGHAYQKSGEFTKATASYEKALAIFERDGQHPTEYATTFAALATLYADTGQTGSAKHVLIRSLHLFENESDHAGAAMMCNDLATIAAEQHSHGEAHRYMARAIAESHLAPDASQDQLSAIITTQARIAELDGDSATAILDYQRALALWKQSHDDQHPDTGWLYVLLGGAYLEAHDITDARETTHRGLTLLENSSGHGARYFAAELAYSKVLDASGDHDEASTLRKEARTGINADTERQRAQSEISIAALH